MDGLLLAVLALIGVEAICFYLVYARSRYARRVRHWCAGAGALWRIGRVVAITSVAAPQPPPAAVAGDVLTADGEYAE